MITTTELIKLLQENENGGISHRARKISLTVNGRYLPEPQITISSTGDGILGPEIDLDVDGEWLEHEADGIDEVLDKISAEIEYHRRKTQSIDPYDLVGDCLDIIDKYRKEAKDK